MNCNYRQLKKIKKQISEIYNIYEKEKTKRDEIVLQIANLFNLDLDYGLYDKLHIFLDGNPRYIIKDIKIDKLQIEIFDNKEKISYRSTYIGDELFEIAIKGPNVNIKYIFDGDLKTEEQISTSENNCKLQVLKKLDKGNKKVTLTYLKKINIKVNNEYERVNQPLLTKSYQINRLGETKEHCFTYCFDPFEKEGDARDEYCYYLNDNVIYGINNVSKYEGRIKYSGVCFKKALKNKRDFDKYRCCGIKKFESMFSENIISAMIFKGSVYPNNYELEILVTKDDYYVNLKTKTCDVYNKEVSNVRQYKILKPDELVTELIKINECFINVIMDDLIVFLTKINLNRKRKPNIKDLTDPRFYLDIDIKQINHLFQQNKSEILELINNQYLKLANLEQEKGNKKTYRKDV